MQPENHFRSDRYCKNKLIFGVTKQTVPVKIKRPYWHWQATKLPMSPSSLFTRHSKYFNYLFHVVIQANTGTLLAIETTCCFEWEANPGNLGIQSQFRSLGVTPCHIWDWRWILFLTSFSFYHPKSLKSRVTRSHDAVLILSINSPHQSSVQTPDWKVLDVEQLETLAQQRDQTLVVSISLFVIHRIDVAATK